MAIQTAAARKQTAAARETLGRVCMFPAANDNAAVVVPTLRAVRVVMVRGVEGQLVSTIECSASTVQPTAANSSNGATVRARKVGK